MESFSWETWGWLMAFCFSVLGLPQVILCHKQQHANGVSWIFLILWMLGEIFGFIYILPRFDIPLLTNYVLNAVFISIIIYYKVKGAKNDTTRN